VNSITYRFPPVRAQRTVRGKCPACGKAVTRSRTFKQTVNPFNRNEDGSVRTYEQVNAEVNAEARAWEPDFRHNTTECSDA
jgi:hypothetical protein